MSKQNIDIEVRGVDKGAVAACWTGLAAKAKHAAPRGFVYQGRRRLADF
jgi:hypothetical protein